MARLFRAHQPRRRPARQKSSSPAGNAPAVGATFTGVVRDVTAEGQGVVPHDSGQVFFVPGVWLDETVEVRVSGFKGRLGFGSLTQLIDPSPHRVEPPCPYQGFSERECGGCPWQFVEYSAQLKAKQARVAQALQALAPPATVKAIWPSPKQFGYRNRAQLKTDGTSLGYLASATNRLVDIADCLILTDKNRHTLSGLRETLPQPLWRAHRKKSLTTLDIDETVTAETASVNARLPFQQANAAQNQAMQKWLSDKLATLDKTLPVLELFAGSGNFTRVVAKAGFSAITAVEVVDTALQQLLGELPQVNALACNLFDEGAASKLRCAAEDPAILILDPPRDGLKNKGLKSSAGFFHRKARLQHVLYISCNLATLVRDLQSFVDHGFAVDEVQPLDQFPHTPHIELLVYLRKIQ